MAPAQPRVLVTGGAGFLGGHLVRALLRREAHVVVLDDLSTGRRDNLPDDPRLDVRIGCVLDEACVAAAARHVSVVYHLAGVVGVRLATRQAARAFEVADVGTRHVLAHAGRARVALVSSSAVHGLTATGPVGESPPPAEADALAYDGGRPGYACGKLALERHGRRAAEQGHDVVMVRPFNVVGPQQSGSYGMVLPRFVRRALDGEPLTIYDDGRQHRAFSDVHTFTEALVALVEHPRARGVYNLGADRPTTVRELAALVLAACESSSPVVHVPYEQEFPGRRDVRARVPDSARLTALLGPIRWPPLAETVERVVAAERRALLAR